MIRLLLGIALAPLAVIVFAASLRCLGSLPGASPSVYPFLGGFALPVAARLVLDMRSSWFGRLVTGFYVLTHEMTHAIATWMGGGKVYGIKAGADGGHVDVSHVSTFASLAPYCVPLPTACVVLGYRAWVWLRGASGGESVFLFLMGLTIAFHLLATLECIWTEKQPDLDAGGGVVFSLVVITLFNGLVFLLVQKTLFPKHLDLAGTLGRALDESAGFWAWLVRGGRDLWLAWVKT
ncbi:MAG: hypothetical protein HZB91_10460 [Elusimicrobia bacterium]|nr:hypothetical protein [Elusimicrobiota bacterium]